MATQTETQQAPQYGIFQRVSQLPMISSAASTIHSTLASNAYTSSPYASVQSISTSALNYSTPMQVRLAPLIERADQYACQILDAADSRYPQIINAKPEAIQEYVRERKESAAQYVRGRREDVSKRLDENVTSPAWHAAQGVDNRFTPIVDFFERSLGGNAEAGPSKPTPAYQYQRAYALSMNLKDYLYVYSQDQISHLQTQNVLVQRATDTAHAISSSINTAQLKAHDLSDTMVAQLQKLQTSTAELSSSLKQSFPNLPEFEHTFNDLAAALHSAITDLRTIMASESSYNEKATLVAKEVSDRVNPLLEIVAERVGVVVHTLTTKKDEVKEEVKEEAEKVETETKHHEVDLKAKETKLEPEWLH